MSESVSGIDQAKQYVSFVLDGEEYGVPILSVQEIIRYESLTRLPQSPEFIEGVLNLRGQVIPVVNLRVKFDLSAKEMDRSTRIIVVEVKQRVVGMVVDQVSEVLLINEDEIAPAPPMGARLRTDFISGMGKIRDKLIILLHIEKILTTDEKNLIEEAVSVTV